MADATETSFPLVSDFAHDLVLETADVEDFLGELVHFSVDVLSDGAQIMCGITLLRRNKVGTVISSSERAQKADELQYRFDDGPCLRATREGVTVRIPDMRTEHRWPSYAPVMVKEGILSAVAVPFELEGETRAALNLYADEANRFKDPVMETVEAHIRQTSKAFRLAVRMAQRTDNAADLKAAMESRTTIDLAVGIIMGQNQCSQEAAAEILKAASSSRNIKLRDLAAQLVAASGGGSPTTHFND
ncbi:GAF and ANTAR domain-containing protein [Arthrobacter sp. AET 35A]|uniref:GAF and ANTAR domain-containing protein n=1 Tax=Arthrobacter sp. AET 35A TaxID=2292643 RepID=UPI00298F1DAF|nr:GAF and ANTAR domain-containing protein [Arthrobacter sp. AET 35A]